MMFNALHVNQPAFCASIIKDSTNVDVAPNLCNCSQAATGSAASAWSQRKFGEGGVVLRATRLVPIALAIFIGTASAQPVVPPQISIGVVARTPLLSDFVDLEPSDTPLGMVRITGFVQRFPNDGQPATEQTLAYVGYDSKSVYVAFHCYDSDPAGIGAHLLPRDSFPNDEDTVAVQIDPFPDLKHGFGFRVNPYAVQADGFYTEGSGWDWSWDTVWQADAKVTADGYIVLFAIPFKSLRFPDTDAQHWRLFLYRGIARKGEEVFWPANSTRFATRFPQAAIVQGLYDVSPARNLQADPYVSSRAFRAPGAIRTAQPTPARTDFAIGGDAKAVIHDSVVFDGTLNPDFSQIESDLPQITVNKPFEVFFPEKRPFFLENAAYFQTPIQLLFTRRITDPSIGARATGRIGPYSLGAMVVDDRTPADAPADGEKAWFGVARVIRDIGGESSIGVYASRRTLGGTSNNVGAIDGRLRLGPNWYAVGQAAMTTATDEKASRDGSAVAASLVGADLHFNYKLDYNDRSPAFHVLDGFIPRVDIRSIDQTFSFRSRPAGALQAWGPDIVVNRTWDHEGHALDYAVTPRFAWQWRAQTILDIYHTVASQTLRPSEVPSIRESFRASADRTGIDFQSAIFPRLLGSVSAFVSDGVNLTPVAAITPPSGRVTDATATTTVRISRSLTIDLSQLVDTLRDRITDRVAYVNNISRVRVGDQLTRTVAVRAIVEYKRLNADASTTTLQTNRNLNYDVLFTYLRSPGSAIFVGANYNMADADFSLPTSTSVVSTRGWANTGWQAFAKMAYLFRW